MCTHLQSNLRPELVSPPAINCLGLTASRKITHGSWRFHVHRPSPGRRPRLCAKQRKSLTASRWREDGLENSKAFAGIIMVRLALARRTRLGLRIQQPRPKWSNRALPRNFGQPPNAPRGWKQHSWSNSVEQASVSCPRMEREASGTKRGSATARGDVDAYSADNLSRKLDGGYFLSMATSTHRMHQSHLAICGLCVCVAATIFLSVYWRKDSLCASFAMRF
ncbi:uncharacterized protein J3D65DRAFT_637079 [Phyllosticta citribraziliensis]|uniref:Uncharacterized protein n=1 Tax=Phyllosticta citribraziliensis TaxID=989973 RepID=A0ABR1LB84_9PEZI